MTRRNVFFVANSNCLLTAGKNRKVELRIYSVSVFSDESTAADQLCLFTTWPPTMAHWRSCFLATIEIDQRNHESANRISIDYLCFRFGVLLLESDFVLDAKLVQESTNCNFKASCNSIAIWSNSSSYFFLFLFCFCKLQADNPSNTQLLITCSAHHKQWWPFCIVREP